MSNQLHEIMITLFRNEEGYTLSVKPNHSYGGKAINFSFKGANTLSLKAVKDLGTANPRVASAIAQMIHKPKFQSIYHNRETVDELRFSKGYLAAQRGKNHGKGVTVPVIAALIRDQNQFAVYLDFGLYDYETELDQDAVTDSQARAGAVAEHRWRDYGDDLNEDIYSFLGGNPGDQ